MRHASVFIVGEVLARAVTHALVGLEPRKVEVEAHLQLGVPGFAIVGLADRACQEAKHRVRSGVVSASLEWPLNRTDHGQSRAGGAAQGGIRVRPSDLAGGPRRDEADPRRAARRARGGR